MFPRGKRFLENKVFKFRTIFRFVSTNTFYFFSNKVDQDKEIRGKKLHPYPALFYFQYLLAFKIYQKSLKKMFKICYVMSAVILYINKPTHHTFKI